MANHMVLRQLGQYGKRAPEESSIEHLALGGIWVGAIIDTMINGEKVFYKSVSTSDWASNISGQTQGVYSSEMVPTDTSNPWHYSSILNGDIGAISESDYSCEYTDTVVQEYFPLHSPLGIKIIQNSYAWAQKVRQPILPIDYTIINISNKVLKNVYIAFSIDTDVGSIYSDIYFRQNCAGYFPEIRTAYVYNEAESDATPIGFTVLKTPKVLSEGSFRFRWFDTPINSNGLYDSDSIRYELMSGDMFPDEPVIRDDQSITDPKDIGILFSFGPIEQWNIGETLQVAIALIGEFTLTNSDNSIYENAMYAHTLYNRNYIPPVVIPSPKLHTETGFQSNELQWKYTGEGINPEEVWDDESQLIKLYPSDHWRRVNPPEGHTKGGRIFEGYRLYRSEDPGGAASSFVMLKQWDIKDSVGPRFDYDTGLEYEYVDSNLQTGKTYWYSVTSYAIPDVNKMEYMDRDGSVKETMLESEGKESSVLGSRKRVKLPFSVSNELGKVLVVPNPYRVDADYTLEFGGYEGRSRSWNENKRILKFTHLPSKCTIRIFTIGGDIVATLHHENQTVGEYDWDMLSESNRTIASGLYVFTVESEFGTQTGKFVVIR